MRAVRHDQIARQLGDGVTQRKVDGHGHDGEGRRPQHHHRLRRVAALARQFGKKFGMTGMAKSGTVENALGDRIGDDRARPSGCHIGYRLANGGDRGIRAGVIGLAGLRRRRWPVATTGNASANASSASSARTSASLTLSPRPSPARRARSQSPSR